MKIEQKGEGENKINIIKFKNFEEIQCFYNVITEATHGQMYIEGDYYLTAYLQQAIIVARTITNKPVLYIVETREYAEDHMLSNLKELSDYVNIFLDYMVSDNTPNEYIKIAKLFKKHVSNFVEPDFYSDFNNKYRFL